MMKKFAGFPDATFAFLRGISKHNEKVWFDANRDLYETGYVAPARAFVAAIGPRLKKISPTVAFDPKVNGSLFRINRDVRFSRDKTPYKNHIDLWFWHGDRRGWNSPGFFFRMFADRLILGAGMHKFEKPQLEAYRAAVVEPRSGKALARAIDGVEAAELYAIAGATRKTVPRGFDAGHERAALLLHDGLTASFDQALDGTARTPEFVDVCLGHFKALWPVAAWLLREVASAGAKG
jgi:uncharacterized protein (TIGR02453 family)